MIKDFYLQELTKLIKVYKVNEFINYILDIDTEISDIKDNVFMFADDEIEISIYQNEIIVMGKKNNENFKMEYLIENNNIKINYVSFIKENIGSTVKESYKIEEYTYINNKLLESNKKLNVEQYNLINGKKSFILSGCYRVEEDVKLINSKYLRHVVSSIKGDTSPFVNEVQISDNNISNFFENILICDSRYRDISLDKDYDIYIEKVKKLFIK